MKLFTKRIEEKLARNGRIENGDSPPVVKVFNPHGPGTWLISEIDPQAPDILFCLADLGVQSPEMGDVYRSELEEIRGPLGFPLERDKFFHTSKPLSYWAKVSRNLGYIPADEHSMLEKAKELGIPME